MNKLTNEDIEEITKIIEKFPDEILSENDYIITKGKNISFLFPTIIKLKPKAIKQLKKHQKILLI